MGNQRYSGVVLFTIAKRDGFTTTTIGEMGFGGDLGAALKQAGLILDSMARVCELRRVAVFIVYKDFGNASVKAFDLPDWLMDPHHYHERYEALKRLYELGYPDSEGLSMLLRFPDWRDGGCHHLESLELERRVNRCLSSFSSSPSPWEKQM